MGGSLCKHSQSIKAKLQPLLWENGQSPYTASPLTEDDKIDKNKDGIQSMRDCMASGSFARGKEEKAASDSMVFVGNINQSVDVLLKTSSLFESFPLEMGTDTAFLDRMHCYIPGWEIPKFRPEHFTNDYGFITDYLAEFVRELRKEPYGDALEEYFRLGRNLNQRDTIAVRKMVGGLVKLMYPDGEDTMSDIFNRCHKEPGCICGTWKTRLTVLWY